MKDRYCIKCDGQHDKNAPCFPPLTPHKGNPMTDISTEAVEEHIDKVVNGYRTGDEWCDDAITMLRALSAHVAELEAASAPKWLDMDCFGSDTDELIARRDFMMREGYRICDNRACNCNSWHTPTPPTQEGG